MTINGIPLHPLIVHAAVVITPAAALTVLIFALKHDWRWATRTPMAVLAVLAALSLQAASMTGDSLKEQLVNAGRKWDSIHQTHEQYAGYTQAAMWVLAAIVLLVWWSFPHVTRIDGIEDRPGHLHALRLPLTALLVLGAVAVIVLVVMTGDAGARAVWG